MDEISILEQINNEAKQDFETSLNEIKKIIKTLENNSLSSNGEVQRIKDDEYQEIINFLNNIEAKYLPSIVKTQSLTEGEQQLVVHHYIGDFWSYFLSLLKSILVILGFKDKLEETQEYQDEIEDAKNEEDLISKRKKIDKLKELTEKCREALNKLKEIDREYELLMNVEPTGNVIDKLHRGPGILDDYRQASWGIDRICLDGFQNHLPEDSKGTKCFLNFLIDSGWVDRDTALQHRDEIKKVRFSDNGVGFTPDNLFYLHSNKTSEDFSAGQFGEGLKLASIASVNYGLGLEIQSRNWKARALGEEMKITNTRKNDEIENRKQLIYDVEIYDGTPIVGSRTIFNTPTKEFIDYALQLPEQILILRNKGVIAETKDGSIVDMDEGGRAFVKGVFIPKEDFYALFSYDFKYADVNPDRNDFNSFYEAGTIANILLSVDDIEIIKTYFMKMLTYSKKTIEDSSKYNTTPSDMDYSLVLNITDNNLLDKDKKDLWKNAFISACCSIFNIKNPEKVVLKTNYEIPPYLKEEFEKYQLINVFEYWRDFLIKIGVQTDESIVPEYIEEMVSTSLSIQYGEHIWDAERIVLDACQNHLPSDCFGTRTFLRFQTKNGEWHDYGEFPRFADEDIKRIKVADDGRGYDYKSLGLLASIKDDNSSGKWGERIKDDSCSSY